MENFYDILGVNENSSDSEIKSAYKKMAVKWHPDKNSGSKESEEMFKKISEAYNVLSDPQKRREYDLSMRGGNSGFNPFEGFGDFSDFFSSRNRGPKKGDNVQIKVKLTLSQILKGHTFKVSITRRIICPDCQGTGGKEITTCSHCGGTGKLRKVVNSPFGRMVSETHCHHCDGRGKIPKIKCGRCNGSGYIKETKEVEIKVPIGVTPGSYLSLSGYGSEILDGINGDLIILVELVDNKDYEIRGLDIMTNLWVSIPEILLGVTKEIELPSGEKTKITIDPSSDVGKVFRIQNKGLIDEYGRRGSIFFKLSIKIPKNINLEEKMFIEKMKKMDSFK